ncbi:MAG: toprim domain-containing protein [Thermoplasmata archaeon]
MRLKEELEGVLDIIEEIKNEDKDIPIIVEGKNDVKALKDLGIERKIVKIKKGKSIIRIIEGLRRKYEKVIILTDWDPTGRKLCYDIKKACQSNDIEYDLDYRKRIVKFLKKEVKDVEGIPSFIKRARTNTDPRKRKKRLKNF